VPVVDTLPTVSIIIPNLNGRKHLELVLSSIGETDYPSHLVETIVVDNGSTDDSVDFVRETYPEVNVITNERNVGYATANNQGARKAIGEYLVFLNNDMKVDKRWLLELIEPTSQKETISVGSKILSWDGQKVDYAGGGSNFYGVGFQEGYQQKDHPRFNVEGPTLFATGASMLIRKDIFLMTGGFDDDYFAYFEDVDLGWRLWLEGYRVTYNPRSVAYHHHFGTAGQFGIHQLRVLHIRNPLYTIIKNYEHQNLCKVLPASLILSLKRTLLLADLHTGSFRMDKPSDLKRLKESVTVPRILVSDLIAYSDLIDNFDLLMKKRDSIQQRRRRTDREIFPLFKMPHWAVEPYSEYHVLQSLLTERFSIRDMFSR